jgi:hypothetical protein
VTRAGLLVAVTTALVAQQPSDPAKLLAKARDVIIARGKRLPDYVCVQTVDRQYFKHLQDQYPLPPCVQIAAFSKEKPLDLVVQSTDRLRVQLKVSQGVEIGAWAGASQFSFPVKSVSNEKRILLSIAGRHPPTQLWPVYCRFSS